MDQDVVVSLSTQAMQLALEVALPLLLVGLVVGLVVSIFQAVTQIQEQTLTFIPKILASQQRPFMRADLRYTNGFALTFAPPTPSTGTAPNT